MTATRVAPVGSVVLGVCTGLAVALGSSWWIVLLLTISGAAIGLWRHPQLPSAAQVAVLGIVTLLPAAVVGGVLYVDADSGAMNSAIVAAVVSGALLALTVWRSAQKLAQADLALGWELARALEAERDSTITAALVAERSLLAGGIHDRLGHRLSLTTVRLGRLSQDPELTAYQRETIMGIREDLAGITDDIGTTVALLQGGEPLQSRAREPQQVVEAARAAGLEVTTELAVLDGANPLARDALSRVLEEALANAARHAPSSPVRATARGIEDSIVLSITNPVSKQGESSPSGAGTGLRRVRDRVTHLGGTLEYSQDNEFTLTVTVPSGAHLHPSHRADL